MSSNKYSLARAIPRVFKYFRINIQNLNALAKNQIFLAHPEMFNDPFDSMINARGDDRLALKVISEFLCARLDGIDRELAQFEDLLLRWGSAAAGIENYSSHVTVDIEIPALSDSLKFFNEEHPKLYIEFKRHVLDSKEDQFGEIRKYLSYTETLGISSFTEKFDSESMWAYYGDNHRGICAEFEVDPSKLGKDLFLQRVEYRDEGDYVDIRNTSLFHLAQKAFVKNMSWSGEQEVRLLSEKRTKQCVKFPGLLRSISYGALTSQDDREMVDRMFGEKENVKLFRMKLRNSSKKLVRIAEPTIDDF